MRETDYRELIRAYIVNDVYVQAYMKLLEEAGRYN